MTKTYRFSDRTEQFVKATDENGNTWQFMLDDKNSLIYQEWFNTDPRPEIQPFIEKES